MKEFPSVPIRWRFGGALQRSPSYATARWKFHLQVEGCLFLKVAVVQTLNYHSSVPYTVILLHGFLMHTALEMGPFATEQASSGDRPAVCLYSCIMCWSAKKRPLCFFIKEIIFSSHSGL